jgi:hypothetical protein
MWLGGNGGCWVLLRLINNGWGAVFVVGLLCGHGVMAEPGAGWPNHPQASVGSGLSEGARAVPLLDWSHAMLAHRVVEQWVAGGSVEGLVSTESIRVAGVGGVRVTLRWSGLTLGHGDAIVPGHDRGMGGIDEVSGEAADLVPLVREATRRALLSVEEKLRGMGRLRASLSQVENGGVPSDEGEERLLGLSDVAGRLQVDLQVVRAARRVLIPDGAVVDEVYSRFSPGYHGLRLAVPGGTESAAWMWPATALAANMSPRSQMVRLLADLGVSPRDLKNVGRAGGLVLERFETIHVVRPGEGLAVVRLERGHEAAVTEGLSGETLDRMADRLAGFLIRRVRSSGGMAGTYHPSTDRYDTQTATLSDTGMAAYALARRAGWLRGGSEMEPRPEGAGGPHAVLREVEQAVAQLVMRLCDELLGGREGNQGKGDPAAMSLTLLALIESPKLVGMKAQRDALGELLQVVCEQRGWLGEGGGELPVGDIDSHSALVAAALTGLYSQTQDASLGRLVSVLRDKVLQEIDGASSPSMEKLPWLGMMGGGKGREDGVVEGGALIGAMALLRPRQIIVAPELGPADMVGGFNLSASWPDGVLQTDWRSAQATAFWAMALRQTDRARGGGAVAELLDCSMAFQYLGRLMFDETACFYVRSHSDALGGVRRSLWDNRLDIAPTAMTLLAVTEFQQTLSDPGWVRVVR